MSDDPLAVFAETLGEVDDFRKYSSDRCVELNSNGATWDCPMDSVDAQASPETVARMAEMVTNRLGARVRQ